jgi:predicted DNA-binding ribbon-helix-helix protein
VVFNRGTKKFYSALKKSTETYETSEDVFWFQAKLAAARDSCAGSTLLTEIDC